MDRFNSGIEEAPPGIERCVECDCELYSGDDVYVFDEGTVCDDCMLGHVTKNYRATL